MTLSTDIYVLGKIDGHDLHRWIHVNLFNLDPDHPVSYKEEVEGQTYTSEWRGTYVARENELANAPGQGFPAWLILNWTDEAREFDNGVENIEELGEDDREWTLKVREAIGSPYFAHLNFDTAYGYRQDGMGCTELHASYIVRLYREYFEPRGIEIVWEDEYRGTYHRNLDSLGMKQFLGAGDEAMEWFANIVPVLQKIAEQED